MRGSVRGAGAVQGREDGAEEVGVTGEGGWVPRVPTCHQVPDEEGFVLPVVLQHALEVLLLPLHGHLPAQFLGPLPVLGQRLGR